MKSYVLIIFLLFLLNLFVLISLYLIFSIPFLFILIPPSNPHVHPTHPLSPSYLLLISFLSPSYLLLISFLSPSYLLLISFLCIFHSSSSTTSIPPSQPLPFLLLNHFHSSFSTLFTTSYLSCNLFSILYI